MTPNKQEPDLSSKHDSKVVPFGMEAAGAWAWRVGVILVVGAMLVWIMGQISILIIPVMIAALLSALLLPIVKLLGKAGMPRGINVAIAEVGLIVVVLGGLFFVGRQLVSGFAELSQQAITGLIKIQEWLQSGPLHLSNDQMTTYLNEALDAVQGNSTLILSKAVGVGSSFGNFSIGLLLTLFILIFFMMEGEKIWEFCVRFFPRRARPAIDGAGRRSWHSLGSYVRIQVFVAAVDAVGIGVGAAIIQVPLALPLGVLVFVGSFIPVVGALVTGAVAVLLALVANGWVNALIMLGIVLLVQQLESQLLQPFVMGKAVSLHPVAVILAVAAGSSVAGILGALFAVPLLAAANSFIRYIAGRDWTNDPELPDIYGLPQVIPGPAPEPAGDDGGSSASPDTNPAHDTEDAPQAR